MKSVFISIVIFTAAQSILGCGVSLATNHSTPIDSKSRLVANKNAPTKPSDPLSSMSTRSFATEAWKFEVAYPTTYTSVSLIQSPITKTYRLTPMILGFIDGKRAPFQVEINEGKCTDIAAIHQNVQPSLTTTSRTFVRNDGTQKEIFEDHWNLSHPTAAHAIGNSFRISLLSASDDQCITLLFFTSSGNSRPIAFEENIAGMKSIIESLIHKDINIR